MMLVVSSDLVELIPQRPHPCDAMHELQVSLWFVVPAGIVDDGGTHRLVDSSRDIKRQLSVVEPPGPGVLVVHPDHLARFAQDSTNAIEEHRLTVGEVEQDEPGRPLV